MTFIESKWRQWLVLIALLTFVTTCIFIPLASNEFIPRLSDLYNHMALIVQAKMALSDGQFPLRVALLEGSGWQYPLYQFYSPTSYAIAALLHKWFFPANPFMAYKALLFLALMIGGVYLYRIAFWFTQSETSAIVGSVVYVTCPYFLVLVNHVGAFNETIALGLVPFCLFYSLRCFYYPDLKAFLLTAISLFMVLTTHILTFACTTLFFGLFLLMLTACDFKKWRNLIVIAVAFVFGCLLASWYLVPIFLVSKYLYLQLPNVAAGFQSSLSYSFLNLIYPGAGYYKFLTSYQVDNTVMVNVGLPILLAVGIACYAIMSRRVKGSLFETKMFHVLLITLFLVFFALVSPFPFWQWVPGQGRILQYVWRLLDQTTWTGALLFAWAMNWLFRGKLDIANALVIIALVLVANASWLMEYEIPYIKLSEVLKTPRLTYNSDVYLIDPVSYAKNIEVIDSVSLVREVTYLNEGSLQLDLSKWIDERQDTQPVFLRVQASLSEKPNSPETLTVVGNGLVLGSYQVRTKEFEWRIPLKNFDTKSLAKIHLHFKQSKQNQNALNKGMHLDKLMLDGFIDPAKVMRVDQVATLCQSKAGMLVCHLKVPSQIQMLELPIFYYPHMLHITLNGKPVSYFSVDHESQLLAGIVPVAGQENVVTMQFQGIAWANHLSLLMWGLAGLLLLMVVRPSRYLFFLQKPTMTNPLAEEASGKID